MTPEQKKVRTEVIVKVAVVAAVGFIIAPIVMAIIKGILGLVVAAALAFTAWGLTPWFAMKVANWRMKLISQEAAKNPIETMRNIYQDNAVQIQDKDRKIVEFSGRLADYKDKLIVFVKRFPDEAPKFQQVASQMQLALASMQRKQSEAKRELSNYGAQIEKAEAIYQMACAAESVTELNKDMQQKVFEDIKKQVSFDSTNHKFNAAVAALALEVDNEPQYTALPVSVEVVGK